jgi:hypothetical protein
MNKIDNNYYTEYDLHIENLKQRTFEKTYEERLAKLKNMIQVFYQHIHIKTIFKGIKIL